MEIFQVNSQDTVEESQVQLNLFVMVFMREVCSDAILPEVISVQLSTHRQTGMSSERSIMLWPSYTYIDCEDSLLYTEFIESQYV